VPLRASISAIPASLPRSALLRMVRVVRLLHRLSHDAVYRQAVLPGLPAAAQCDPGHDAVMMGYDFHLDADGNPQIIEVNTNAGGALLAWLAHYPAAATARECLPERLRWKFLQAFAEEMQRFSRGELTRPRSIVILDEKPQEQFLYREMQAFAELFREWGVDTWIADPGELSAGDEGVYIVGRRVDMVYNRHCDFYLESAPLAGLRAAYRARTVCLTPNPFIYGLLADKQRLIRWADSAWLSELGLTPQEVRLLTSAVPESRMLADCERESLWRDRNRWVFKPVDRFGSRGVLLGRKISRARFATLPPAATLVQREVPPSETLQGDGSSMKTDFRLYAYRNRVLGLTARLYQGQVTNLRTPGGGFAPVRVR